MFFLSWPWELGCKVMTLRHVPLDRRIFYFRFLISQVPISDFCFRQSQNTCHQFLGSDSWNSEKGLAAIQSFLIQHIYNWRCTKTNPCLRVFLARLNNVYQLETIITKSNKTSFHLWKWQALLRAVTQLRINTCYGLVVLILSLCVVCAVHACVSYLFIILEKCNVGNVNKN